jgi:hypothetical protein
VNIPERKTPPDNLTATSSGGKCRLEKIDPFIQAVFGDIVEIVDFQQVYCERA